VVSVVVTACFGTLKIQKLVMECVDMIRQKKIAELRERIQRKFDRSKERENLAPPSPAPRYDLVFAKGQKWLDEIAGGPVQESQGEIIFAPDIWKHPGRTESDAS
jgi:hypothetical protein